MLVVALFAGLVVVSMIPGPNDMLFPVHAVPGPGPLPKHGKLVTMTAADGAILHGVHIPAANKTGTRTLVLGFGGNA